MKSFPKSERLKAKIRIEKLFKSKNFFVHENIKVYWDAEISENQKIKVLISVPKNFIDKSVDRNMIKRYLRESYRLNKLILKTENKLVYIGIVYLSPKISSFKVVEKKIKLILHRLKNEI